MSPVKPEKNACPASVLFQCSLIRSVLACSRRRPCRCRSGAQTADGVFVISRFSGQPFFIEERSNTGSASRTGGVADLWLELLLSLYRSIAVQTKKLTLHAKQPSQTKTLVVGNVASL